MAYPYNLGQQNTDPDDPRYTHYQGGSQNAGYYRYGEDLVIEDDEQEQQLPHLNQTYSHASYPPQVNVYPSTSFSDTSGPSSSGFWSSAGHTRGIHSSITSPDDELPPVPTGQRCIFYWIDCRVRHSNPDDWVEHIYYDHFKQEENAGRHYTPDFGRMPRSWTCRFRGCGFVVTNDDHRSLWDDKLAHIFAHLKVDKGRPEEIQEDSTWLKYYYQMGLCHAVDVYGGAIAPHPTKPFTQGVMNWKKVPRKSKQLSRGDPHQDASGEPMYPVAPQQAPLSGYRDPPPLHYVDPSPQHQPYPYQPMDPGPYSPQGPDQYHFQPGPVGHPGPVGY